MVLLIIPKTLLALLHAATHCCELFISLDIIIPKSFSIISIQQINLETATLKSIDYNVAMTFILNNNNNNNTHIAKS